VSAVATTPASRVLDSVLAALDAAGITASRDAGAFYPQPVGVLVGLPALVRRSLAARVFEIAVFVVSGDPLNSPATVDRLFALADDVALALGVDAYRPSTWRSTVNAEPLPAVELTVTYSITESEV
jgi:hypothetical protein